MNAVSYAKQSIEEIGSILETVDSNQTNQLEEEILKAEKILIGGAGRSFLSMKFFAMRLMHLNFRTYLVGDVCTPSIQKNDLLIVGSNSGETPSILAMVQKAKKIGACVAIITMNDEGPVSKLADCVVKIGKNPVCEGAMNVEGWNEDIYSTIRPSGNIFEMSMAILLDCVIGELMVKTAQPLSVIMQNHANLE